MIVAECLPTKPQRISTGVKLIKFAVSYGLDLRALCAVTQGLKLRALTRFHLLTVAEVLPTVQTSQMLVFTG